jgi:hypothetical protein
MNKKNSIENINEFENEEKNYTFLDLSTALKSHITLVSTLNYLILRQYNTFLYPNDKDNIFIPILKKEPDKTLKKWVKKVYETEKRIHDATFYPV